MLKYINLIIEMLIISEVLNKQTELTAAEAARISL